MSHFSVRGEQSTNAEIEALANLTALATSGAGEFIRKTGPTTFENATPGGGGGGSLTVGTTTISSGNDGYILYNNAGVLGNLATTGSGSVVRATSPTISTSLILSYGTASTIAILDGSKNLISADTATYPSLTEFSYLKGVSSAIQTQINTKAPSTSPTFATSVNLAYATASTIAIIDASKNLISADTATYPSLTEFSYLKGVTSAIQTQINGKQASGTYVTSISIASSNGFAGSSSGGATPTLTISTSITGILKGNGTAISAAVSGTDYVIPGAATSSGLTMATSRLLGRTTASTGAIEEISIGTSLSLSAGSLNAIQDIRTSASPQFTGINLGHASDTTLERVSAGVVSIEGVNIVTVSSTDTLSNKTLTAPKFADLGFIADANGNELIIFDTVASAVNEITYANAATGNNPAFTASGGDTNIGFNFTTKGTGTFNIRGNSTQPGELRLYEDTDLGTNYTAFKVGTQSADISYVLPTAQGAASTVLTNDGSGNLSWAAAGGSSGVILDVTDEEYYVVPYTMSLLSGSGSGTGGGARSTANISASTYNYLGKIRINQGGSNGYAFWSLPNGNLNATLGTEYTKLWLKIAIEFPSGQDGNAIGFVNSETALDDAYTAVTKSIRVLVDNTQTMYFITANGTNQQRTTITGITYNQNNSYLIVIDYNSGSPTAILYVNGTEKANHTTYVPTDAYLVGLGWANTGNAFHLLPMQIGIKNVYPHSS